MTLVPKPPLCQIKFKISVYIHAISQPFTNIDLDLSREGNWNIQRKLYNTSFVYYRELARGVSLTGDWASVDDSKQNFIITDLLMI